MEDVANLWVDGDRLHTLVLKEIPTDAETRELISLFTTLAKRQCHWAGAPPALVPLVVDHCLHKLTNFNAELSQAFSFFTVVVCNRIRWHMDQPEVVRVRDQLRNGFGMKTPSGGPVVRKGLAESLRRHRRALSQSSGTPRRSIPRPDLGDASQGPAPRGLETRS